MSVMDSIEEKYQQEIAALKAEVERLREALESIFTILALGHIARERDSFTIAQAALAGKEAVK